MTQNNFMWIYSKYKVQRFVIYITAYIYIYDLYYGIYIWFEAG